MPSTMFCVLDNLEAGVFCSPTFLLQKQFLQLESRDSENSLQQRELLFDNKMNRKRVTILYKHACYYFHEGGGGGYLNSLTNSIFICDTVYNASQPSFKRTIQPLTQLKFVMDYTNDLKLTIKFKHMLNGSPSD